MSKIKIRDIDNDAFVKKAENKKLILRALTDKKFREQLKSNPEKIFDVKGGGINRYEISTILNTVNLIESRLHSAADEVLCCDFMKTDYFKISR